MNVEYKDSTCLNSSNQNKIPNAALCKPLIGFNLVWCIALSLNQAQANVAM